MDIAQLANVGEFIGGIAVLVTLFYLAYELRRNRADSEANSVDALVARLDSFNADFHNNAELCEIFMRGNNNPEDLQPIERTRYLALTQRLINHFMTIKRSRDRGVLPDEEWLAYGVGTANFLNSPGGEWACSQAATTDEVRSALRELTSQSDQSANFNHWKGMAPD
jgi:hypothetical protein